MTTRTNFWVVAGLGASLLLLTVLGCGESQPKGMYMHSGHPTRTPPLLPATPTVSHKTKRENYPMEIGDNKGVVDGDIYVWKPPCPPRPPDSWYTVPVLLHHLDSGSYLHLDWDGSVSAEAPPDYRNEEGRERLEEVLADGALMRFILAPLKCS